MKIAFNIFALLVIFWGIEILVLIFDPPSYVLIGPYEALSLVLERWPLFANSAVSTILLSVIGFACAVLVSAALIFVSYMSQPTRALVTAATDFLQSFPKEALFPIFLLWFGFGAQTKVLNAFLLSVIPLLVTLNNSVLNVRSDYVEFFESFSPNRLRQFFLCRVPASIPAIHSAVRLALPLALIGTVLGEFLGGGQGLGTIILSGSTAFRVDMALASIYTLASIGTISLTLVDVVFFLGLKRYFEN